MATILIEGFDHSGTIADFGGKGWQSVVNGATAGINSMQVGRLSGRSVRINPGNNVVGPITGAMIKALPATYTTLFAGFAFQYNSTLTDSPIFQFQQVGGAAVASVWLQNSTGRLYVTNAAGSTVATGSTILAVNTWYYIELEVVVAGASGTCELRLNGIAGEVPSTTGNFGSTAIGRIQFSYWGPANSSGLYGYFDDIYVADSTGAAPRNTFMGDNRVETLYPVADGANTAWTPSSGTAHWSRVNETTPDGDTTYVSSSNPGDRDSYQYNSLSTLVGVVHGVQTNLLARKDDAAARQIADVIRMGGTNYDGTTTAGLTTSYLYYSTIHNQAPTGSDWTISSVNTTEFGVKEVT
jgi:hypothetical protein